MNQYTTTTIINDITRVEGNTTGKLFTVKGTGTYRKEDIESIYKRGGTKSVKEVGTLTIPTLDAKTEMVRLRLEFNIVKESISEFKNGLTRDNKIIYLDFNKDTPANIADSITKAIKNYNNLSENPKCTVSNTGAVVTITSVQDYIRLGRIEFQELNLESITGYDDVYKATKIVITTKGAEGFGDYNWILHNFRLPTETATSWLAVLQDERPVPGTLYNQYTLTMVVKRRGIGSSNGVGQEITSTTTHVFYVAGHLSKAFETEVLEAGVTITPATTDPSDKLETVGD